MRQAVRVGLKGPVNERVEAGAQRRGNRHLAGTQGYPWKGVTTICFQSGHVEIDLISNNCSAVLADP
jgi:hypothetical protein